MDVSDRVKLEHRALIEFVNGLGNTVWYAEEGTVCRCNYCDQLHSNPLKIHHTAGCCVPIVYRALRNQAGQ